MEQEKYRPLIKLQSNIEYLFLPVQYIYTLNQIAKIKKSLPKTLSFVGVDAQSYSEDEKGIFQKEKLKLKAVGGKSIVDDKPLKFYKEKQLKLIEWKDVYICVNIPFNSRQNEQQIKQQLEEKLNLYIQTGLCFRNKETKQFYKNNCAQNINPQNIEIYFEPKSVQQETFDNCQKQIRFNLPISIILFKKQEISIASLFQYLRDDVLNSLKIMIKHNLCIRVIKGNTNLILQSFIKQEGQRASEEGKLLQLISKQKAERQIDVQQQQQTISQQSRKQDPSNKTLLVILICLAALYLYFKLNPLASTIESL